VPCLELMANNTLSDDVKDDTSEGHSRIAFILLCSGLVFLMTPGIAMYYSAMLPARYSTRPLLLTFAGYAVVMVQWYLVGFSLALSPTGGPFIGDFKNAVGSGSLRYEDSGRGLSDVSYSFFQLQFATCAVALMIGSVADRARVFPALVFMLFFTTLVYDVIVSWIWSANGWLANLGGAGSGLGALDFAGGGPVHIASGFSALAYAIVAGPSRPIDEQDRGPHNVPNVMLGTGLIWFGWLGFNGGSALDASDLAVFVCFVTYISASVGGLIYLVLSVLRTGEGGATFASFAEGVIIGLVGITPAAGYVSIWAGVVIGAVTSAICHTLSHEPISLAKRLGVDDVLNCFVSHGVGGCVGCFLTGLFADRSLAALRGEDILDGLVYGGGGLLLGYQVLAIAAQATYSFCTSYIILKLLDFLVTGGLAISPDDESQQLEDAYVGLGLGKGGTTIAMEMNNLLNGERELAGVVEEDNQVNT